MEERERINRVEKDVQQWLHNNPRSRSGKQRYQDRKLEFLEKLTTEYKGRTYTKEEEKAIQKAEQEKARLYKRMQPWKFERWLGHFSNPLARFLTHFLRAFRDHVYAARADRPLRTKKAKNTQRAKRPEETSPDKRKKAIGLKGTVGKDIIPPKEVAEQLKRVLARQGIHADLNDETWKAIERKEKWIFIKSELSAEKDLMKYVLRVDRSDESGHYYPANLHLQLKKNLPVDARNSTTLDVAALEKRMQQIDWKKDYFSKGVPVSPDPAENKRLFKEVNGIFKALLTLWSSGRPEDRKAHDALAFKYLIWTPAEQMLPGAAKLKEHHLMTMHVNLLEYHEPAFSMRQYYNLLEGRPVQGPKDADGQARWYEAGKNRYAEESPDSLQVHVIPGSEQFSLKDALVREGFAGNKRQLNEWMRQLENGEKIEATLLRNGSQQKRVISLSPDSVRPVSRQQATLLFDLQASREKGLYQPETKDLRRSIDHYHAVQKYAMWDRAEKWQQRMNGKAQTNGHDLRKVLRGKRIG